MKKDGYCDTITQDDISRNLQLMRISNAIDLPLSSMTTFRTGGLARNIAYPRTIRQLDRLVAYAKENELPYFILGNGSNVLASDKGYRGLLIICRENLSQISYTGNTITANAGASTMQISMLGVKQNLTRVEFLSLIPSTIGGAIVGNAGCFGYQTADIVKRVYATCGNGIEVFEHNECQFGYRKSIFVTNGYVVAKAVLKCPPNDGIDSNELINAMRSRKIATQPIGKRTAGSVFINGESYSAAELIDKCKLKGFSIGDAVVSELHSNFIVNRGKATSQNIYDLISIIRNVVFEKYGIILNTEIKLLGDF